MLILHGFGGAVCHMVEVCRMEKKGPLDPQEPMKHEGC